MRSQQEMIEEIVEDSYELPNRVIEAVPHPKVTVRTKTYNHAPFIEKCIEGVLMQETDFQIEYIIGEDFSTDGTREIVFSYAEKYPEMIRVVTADRNVGIKANSYRCRKRTRGEFTALCEGDDFWTDPKKLQKQIDLLAEHPECDLCFHPAKIVYVDSDGREAITGRQASGNCIIPVKNLIFGYGDFCPTASLVVRTEINTYLGDWYLKAPIGDYYYQILGAERGGALYLDEVMSVYNQGSHGLWSQLSKEYKNSDDLLRYKRLLLNCRILKEFDKAMNFRQHKWLKKIERKKLFKKFMPFYSFNRKKRMEIKEMIRQHSEGSIKMSCYGVIAFSFFYHTLNAKKLIPALRKIINL